GAKNTPVAGPAPAGAIAGKPGDALAPATLATLPVKGYVVARSAPFGAPSGDQEHGEASCPAGTVPFGGGVAIVSGSTAANVNSSYPTTSGWAADVNNASPSATSFTVYVTCGKQPKRYEQVNGAWATVLAGEQSSPTVDCTLGMVSPLGGGGY